jgi:SAM-dependent methyltransferase
MRRLRFELVRRGAQRVVGADIGGEKALRNLAQERPEIQQRVEILKTHGTLRELGDERFDLVFSKDSFEHFSDPERVVEAMVGAVRPGGQLVIGFGPLWKGPTGGHIDFVTKLPWAHLLFPEPVIMAERRRFRPDEGARRFEEIKGGLTRMTLDRSSASWPPRASGAALRDQRERQPRGADDRRPPAHPAAARVLHGQRVLRVDEAGRLLTAVPAGPSHATAIRNRSSA